MNRMLKIYKDNLKLQKKRKRARNVQSWKINQRKLSRNSGMKYISKKGATVPEKKFSHPDCGCAKKCFTKYTENERRLIFESF